MKLILTDGSETFRVWLKIKHYGNGNLAIVLYYMNGGILDIWTVVTVNLALLICDENCAYIDVNNNGKEILTWLVQNKLATPTKRIDRYGYCIYPMYQFDPEALKSCDPEGYAEYIKYWRQCNVCDE